jgi:hypothetical protein
VATPQAAANDFRVKEAWVLAVEAALEGGDLETATSLIDEVGSGYGTQRRHFQLAHLMRLRAAVAVASGTDDGMEDGLKGAIGLFRELAYSYWTARTLLDQAGWLALRGRADEAAAALAEGRGIFEALGATPWVTRADAAREALSGTPAA